MYEYECICGYIWIGSENNGCPMCDVEPCLIAVQDYENLPPDKLNQRT